MKYFSILIATKNRLEELKYTLQKIQYLINKDNVECIICDDGSTDGTSKFILKNYPEIKLIKNKKSKGLIYSRNKLLNLTKADYAISLDDDSNFITERPLKIIQDFFEQNPKCGVIAFRIFWGINLPQNLNSNEKTVRVKGFVGCGHVWNIKVWREIPNYPDWFVFYGEEDYAAFHLFKEGWEVHYLPEILVQHRVDISERKSKNDYILRLRRSFRSGWYLYLMFYPWKYIPKRLLYTFWVQMKLKVLKGDLRAFIGIFLAKFDCLVNIFRLLKNSNRLTNKEFEEFLKLPDTKLFWKANKR